MTEPGSRARTVAPARRSAVAVVVPVVAAATVATALCGGLAACSPTRQVTRTQPPSTVVTGTRTVVTTVTNAPPRTGIAPATSVAAFPPSGKAPKGEKLASCPYIKGGLDSQPTDGANVADIEGDRVGSITVLTRYRPVGCRFYFSYSYGDTRHEAIADIEPYTLASPAAATRAMLGTANAGSEPETVRDFADGLTGIRYRTRFFGPDGAKDWAFVFAKGRVLVVVHTQQTNASFNAQALAAAIAPKF